MRTVIEIKESYEAGEPITAEERQKVNPWISDWKVKVGGSNAPITSTLTAINELLNVFKFNIEQEGDNYFISDCRKTPPKRINGLNPYKTEKETVRRMGGVILAQYETSSLLYKLAKAYYSDLDKKLKENKKYK